MIFERGFDLSRTQGIGYRDKARNTMKSGEYEPTTGLHLPARKATMLDQQTMDVAKVMNLSNPAGSTTQFINE